MTDVVSQLWNIFWIVLLIAMFMPQLERKMLEAARMRLMRQIEKKRGSRVICMIHRQESMALLGFPFFRYIDIEDSEQVLRAIKMTPADMPIDFIIHTPGGLVLAAEQIAIALKKHKAPVRVLVPHYAMSGGTLIALAADEIIMDENAVLGPVDPQLGKYPAASILRAIEQKDINKIDDETLILADISKKALKQMEDFVFSLLKDKMDEDRAESVAKILTSGIWTHDYPLTVEQLRKLGLNVSTKMPQEVYDLMALYPQPMMRRPSVQYVPTPYGRKEGSK
ncbi:MAG TPA: hypothetical protein ENF26_04450 [Methanomicrobia archaeon]|nr:hypothetical protein [Methanomicrobia archaeon]HEX59382.1 hypothetical protein [Methanomicrobia archaeon]